MIAQLQYDLNKIQERDEYEAAKSAIHYRRALEQSALFICRNPRAGRKQILDEILRLAQAHKLPQVREIVGKYIQ